MKRTIRVRAGNGIKMPIHPAIAMDTAETHFTDSVEIQVIADHPFIRRCLRNGDLVELKEAKEQVKDAWEKASPAAAEGLTPERVAETMKPSKGRKE